MHVQLKRKWIVGWKHQLRGKSGLEKISDKPLIRFKYELTLSKFHQTQKDSTDTRSYSVPRLESRLDTIPLSTQNRALSASHRLCSLLKSCTCHLTCLSWKMPPVQTSLAGVTSTGQYSPFSFSSRIWTQSSTFRVTSLHLQNTSNAVSFFLSFFFCQKKKRRKEKERRKKKKTNYWPWPQTEEVKERSHRCCLLPHRIISCANKFKK